MKNMDYEKAYKAVLQTATQWINDGCTDKEKICLECVFPELRESEKPMNQEGLKEEINRTYHDGSVADTSDMDHVTYENIAEYFYDLGCRRTAEKFGEIEYNRQMAKEQMMEEAVEGEVVQDLKGVNRVKSFSKIPERLHFGDKVRIIIVKE